MSRVHLLSQNRPGPRMGMGHYERLLIQHLGLEAARVPGEWEFSITFDGRTPTPPLARGDFDPALESADFLGFATLRLARLPSLLVQASLRARFKSSRADLFHSLALSFPAPRAKPTVITIHDLPSAHFADEGTLAPWAKAVARDAAAILTPSHFAKTDLIRLLELEPARVHVVPNGCEHDRYHPQVAPAGAGALRTFGIDGPFLFYAGGSTRRKNVSALLEAWKSIADFYPDLSLVLAGPAAGLQPLAQACNAPRTRVAGYVPFTQMPGVMKAARALICPSIHEGFGLPPLEAMALGVPVVGSKTGGAVPEVIGEAGVLAPDGSPDALADAIRQLLDNPELQARLQIAGPQRARDFSWAAHAQTVLGIYHAVSA